MMSLAGWAWQRSSAAVVRPTAGELDSLSTRAPPVYIPGCGDRDYLVACGCRAGVAARVAYAAIAVRGRIARHRRCHSRRSQSVRGYPDQVKVTNAIVCAVGRASGTVGSYGSV